MTQFLCPECTEGQLVRQQSGQADETHSIERAGFVCNHCQVSFPLYCGVPYLGRFNESDFFSVMEISSLLNQYTLDEDNKPCGLDGQSINVRDNYLRVQQMVAAAGTANADDFDIRAFGYDALPPWFDARFNEYEQFKIVTAGLDFNAQSILDIGAGTGFDASRFHSMGGAVTSLEYSPLQCAIGAANFPEITWIGGSVTRLPFAGESFDFVIANAALHHVLDLENAIEEMLRVLKVGGYLLTLADSFGPDRFTETDEVEVFNSHPAVLAGVNEQIPKISRFLGPLAAHADKVTVEVMTSIVHGLHARTSDMRRWSLEQAAETLRKYRGGLCMRVKKCAPTVHATRTRAKELISFEDYLPSLRKRSGALARLAPCVPDWALDRPIIDDSHDKFRLLLGWRKQGEGVPYREAVKEAYLFVTAEYLRTQLPRISLRVPKATGRRNLRTIEIAVNTKPVHSQMFESGRWFETNVAELDWTTAAADRNLLTFRLVDPDDAFEMNIFQVANIKMLSPADRFFHEVLGRYNDEEIRAVANSIVGRIVKMQAGGELDEFLNLITSMPAMNRFISDVEAMVRSAAAEAVSAGERNRIRSMLPLFSDPDSRAGKRFSTTLYRSLVHAYGENPANIFNEKEPGK